MCIGFRDRRSVVVDPQNMLIKDLDPRHFSRLLQCGIERFASGALIRHGELVRPAQAAGMEIY